jgi:hypothetical protein
MFIELQVSHFRFRVSLCPINGPRPRISPARTVEIPEATYLKLNRWFCCLWASADLPWDD